MCYKWRVPDDAMLDQLVELTWENVLLRHVLQRHIVERQRIWTLRDEIAALEAQLTAAREEIRRMARAAVEEG